MKRITVRLGDPSLDVIPLIAHDLRTPLTAIKGLSQLSMRRSDIPAPVAQYLLTIVDEANHIASLVDDLVLASRLERGEIDARRSNVDICALLQSILDDPSNVDDGLRPVLALTRRPPVAYCDPQILARAFVRLLAVATRRTRLNESISVGAQEAPSGIEITITPYSSHPITNGVPKRLAQHATTEDERSESISPNLSVALATTLIEAQGGRFLYDVSPDGHARFHVFLPEARDS